MQTNPQLKNSTNVEEDPLDAKFKKYITTLQLLCSRHTNCTDLVLCRNWVRRLALAKKEERYARNYLMFFLCKQIASGYLNKPFTDGRNLDPQILLRDIVISFCKSGNQWSQLPNRRSVPDVRSVAFRNYCAGLESLRQRSLSQNSRSFDRRGKTDTGIFYNYGQTYNQTHSQRGQPENRVFISFLDPSHRKYGEYGKEAQRKQFERSFQQRSGSADRPSGSLPYYQRENGMRSKSVLPSNGLYRLRQSPVAQHMGRQYQFINRGVAGGNKFPAYQDEMDSAMIDLYKLKNEYGMLSDEYRRKYLQIKQFEAKRQQESNRLPNNCYHNYGHNSTLSSEVPISNKHYQQQSLQMRPSHFQECHEDPDDGAYGGVPSNYNTNANIKTNTNINKSNNNTPILPVKKHIEMLQKQLIKSAHITIDQLNQITYLNEFETQQQITQDRKKENYQQTMPSCKHQFLSKSLAALSYNDKSFDEFLRRSDVHVDKLMNAIFVCNSEIRKRFVERELDKLWQVTSEQYNMEYKLTMKQHKNAEKLHTGLNELRMLTILKKLFLENCVHKLDHVDKVIERLDKEFALMKNHL